MARNLIIIPGLGDRRQLYLLLKPLWALFGFRTKIFTYGWDSRKNNTLALQRLLHFVDSTDEKFYVIGISAGGTAAVNLLACRPSQIIKVVTVCTPYLPMPRLHHPLLRQSIDELQPTLSTMNSKTKKNILALYARKDKTVPPAYGAPLYIQTKELGTNGHALSIFLSVTFFSGIIRRFFC